MNLDDLLKTWRSQDLAPLYGVDKTALHQVLRQERAKLEKQRRRTRWIMYAVTALLMIMGALFLAIMIDPNQPPPFASRRGVWDYVVGGVGVIAAVVIAVAMFALRRSHHARERGFGDSLRDHLRRRIAQIDDEGAGERRLTIVVVSATLICGSAISVVSGRIRHVPVPWSETDWPSPVAILLILGFVCLLLFRWVPRGRRRSVARKRQLEDMLRALESE